MPAFNGGDDFVGISFPDEWCRFIVMLFDEAIDGRLEVADGLKDAVLQSSACQFCEEALDGVQP